MSTSWVWPRWCSRTYGPLRALLLQFKWSYIQEICYMIRLYQIAQFRCINKKYLNNPSIKQIKIYFHAIWEMLWPCDFLSISMVWPHWCSQNYRRLRQHYLNLNHCRYWKFYLHIMFLSNLSNILSCAQKW